MTQGGSILPADTKQAVDCLGDVLRDISRHIVAQEHVIKATGIALVAGANLFVQGTPGVSKTFLTKLLAARLNGKFHRILYGPYLEPEAVFGGQDVNAFMKGEYARHREGTILDANVHFGDEFLEANDAMKVAMLGLFDEVPTYDERGKTEYLTDLLLVVVASNRLPGKDDAAISDRLVLQIPVQKPLERESKLEILYRHDRTQRGELSLEPQASISIEQIKLLRKYSREQVQVPPGIYEKLVSLDEEITDKIGYLSPRTLNRCLDILKAAALLRGQTEVSEKDFGILQYVVAPIPQQPKARDIILDLTAPLEKEAMEVYGAIAKEIGAWQILAGSKSKLKKAQAKKGSRDLLNSILDYQVTLEDIEKRARKEGYDVEGIREIITNIEEEYNGVITAERKLYQDLSSDDDDDDEE